jgi:hypothetical protein
LITVILDKGFNLINRLDDHIAKNEENADMEEIGEVTLKQAKITPVVKIMRAGS